MGRHLISSARQILLQYLETDIEISIEAVSGGDTHSNYIADYLDQRGDRQKLFVKINRLENEGILRTEYQSLLAFSQYPQLHYPRALHFQVDHENVYLIIVHHAIEALGDDSSRLAGIALAHQHAVNHDTFGWHADNYIGVSLQPNHRENSWADFFLNARLLPQLSLAKSNNLALNTLNSIEFNLERFEKLLLQRKIQPSLLHGDLWSGNLGFDLELARPIFFDPAPYFGDPEVDLAMTRLFGGFSPSFYQAYYSQTGDCKASDSIHALYNLYHALNHFNLFGHNYQTLVERQVNETGFVT